MNGLFEDTIAGFRDRFNSAIADFDAQVANLAQTESDLWTVQPDVQASGDTALQAQWQDAMNRVIAMNSTIDSVRSQVQSVSDWWTGVKASFGIPAGTPGTLSGAMGLLPVIPWSVIALVVGGTTAIAGVIYAASLVINRARQYALQQANIQAAQTGGQQVTDVVAADASTGGGFFDSLGNLANAVPWLVGGAVVLLVLPHLKGRE